jgi:hypothetical protein
MLYGGDLALTYPFLHYQGAVGLLGQASRHSEIDARFLTKIEFLHTLPLIRQTNPAHDKE